MFGGKALGWMARTLNWMPGAPRQTCPLRCKAPDLGGAGDRASAQRGDLVVSPDQAATASAPGRPCLGVLSLVHDTLVGGLLG